MYNFLLTIKIETILLTSGNKSWHIGHIYTPLTKYENGYKIVELLEKNYENETNVQFYRYENVSKVIKFDG